jgi:hypothetical protein
VRRLKGVSTLIPSRLAFLAVVFGAAFLSLKAKTQAVILSVDFGLTGTPIKTGFDSCGARCPTR